MFNPQPTYSTEEVLLLLINLDFEGLQILGDLLIEEKRRYCTDDLKLIKKAFVYYFNEAKMDHKSN